MPKKKSPLLTSEISNLVKKSIAASLLISLGDYALLKLGNPIGPVIFAFGLLGVCFLGLNLFTGKCGFLFENSLNPWDLLIILVLNLQSGFLFGLLLSFVDPDLIDSALTKVSSWSLSPSFFGKALLCGIIMYIAVKMYQKQTPLGIIFGIPLFIFCGFQHCIANVITLGVSRTTGWTLFLTLLLAVLGNFLGSLLASFLIAEKKSLKVAETLEAS